VRGEVFGADEELERVEAEFEARGVVGAEGVGGGERGVLEAAGGGTVLTFGVEQCGDSAEQDGGFGSISGLTQRLRPVRPDLSSNEPRWKIIR
jgi:hypothetical protein